MDFWKEYHKKKKGAELESLNLFAEVFPLFSIIFLDIECDKRFENSKFCSWIKFIILDHKSLGISKEYFAWQSKVFVICGAFSRFLPRTTFNAQNSFPQIKTKVNSGTFNDKYASVNVLLTSAPYPAWVSAIGI